jgi:archaellum biogenesis protein FlaJ (TadC family)
MNKEENLLQKKKQIDEIFKDFIEKMNIIKQKLNKVVFEFMEYLREKKIEELKKDIKEQ